MIKSISPVLALSLALTAPTLASDTDPAAAAAKPSVSQATKDLTTAIGNDLRPVEQKVRHEVKPEFDNAEKDIRHAVKPEVKKAEGKIKNLFGKKKKK